MVDANYNLTEEELELLDPNPDIHGLFVHYSRCETRGLQYAHTIARVAASPAARAR